jgi:hypothetical protein
MLRANDLHPLRRVQRCFAQKHQRIRQVVITVFEELIARRIDYAQMKTTIDPRNIMA